METRSSLFPVVYVAELISHTHSAKKMRCTPTSYLQSGNTFQPSSLCTERRLRCGHKEGIHVSRGTEEVNHRKTVGGFSQLHA